MLVAAPTGTGKSYTATKLMLEFLNPPKPGRVSFYLVPLKSLAEEVFERFRNEMKAAGLESSGLAIATGDYDDPVDLTSASLVVATYEKLLSMIRSGTEFRPYIVVADEFQIVADGHRGPRIEALMSLKFRGSDVVLFVLSAVVGNPEEISKWLGIGHVTGDRSDRKVPLEIKGMQRKDPSEFVRGQVETELKSKTNTQLLVFCNRKDGAEDLAASLAEITSPTLSDMERKTLKSYSDELLTIGKFNSDIAGLCEQGVAYHHSLLTKETRKVIESAFKSPPRALKVICSTPTLAQGINTPARVVIVKDITRYDGGTHQQEILPLSELLNMVGRAGRPDFNQEEGLAYVVSKNDVRNLVDKLKSGKGEPLKSALGDTFSNVAKFVLQCIRSIEDCDLPTIQDAASKMLWAHQNGMSGSTSNTAVSILDYVQLNFKSELKSRQIRSIEMNSDMSGPFIQAEVRSSRDPTKAYQVRVYEGVYSCECRGYRTHRTICKHIRGVVAECLSGIAASDPAVRDFATLAAFECLKKPDIQMQIRYSLDLLTRWQLVENRNGTYKITDLGESAARSYLPLNRLHALWEHMRTLKQVKSDREYLALVYADSEGITPDLIDVRVLDSLEEWMKGEPPEQIVVTGRYKKYQEFLEVRDAIVYALENCIDFASIIGRDALVKYIRNLRRRVRFGVSLELMPLVSLHIEGLSREEAGLLFKVGIRDLKTLASAPAESVLKAIGEKAKKVQPTARELLERMQGSAGDPRETRRFLSTYRINWSDAEEYLGVRLEV